MERAIKYFTGIVCFCLTTPHLFSQDYYATMDHIFEHVDKSKITTGLLSDYGMQMVDIEVFDGIPADSNYVNMDSWKKLYNGLYSSKINTNANLLLPDTVVNRIDNTQEVNEVVPVAMMHFQYNKLNDDAVNLGLLQVVDDQIYEVSGAASPYFTKQLFAVAPKSVVFGSRTASFVFKPSLWFSNSGKTVQQIEVNFNNESGYIPASWNSPVSYMFVTRGTKTIYFRLTYTDGSSYTSQTNVLVEGGGPQYAPVDPTRREDILITATTEHSGGTLQIYYASSNTLKRLGKTLIVAEGYDPSCIMGVNNMGLRDFIKNGYGLTSIGTIDVPVPGTSYSLLDYVDANDYDIVYVDYNNGVDDIRRNAKLFQEAIEWVNAHKDIDEPNVVMGISMGGLVARYALRKMEIEGKNHQTCKYISIDSPHKGANVPVGVQALVRHIENLDVNLFWFFTVWNPTNIEDFGNVADLLNSQATKQLLIYYVNNNLTYDNSEHNTFMTEYESMGPPLQCQNIAVANGSNDTTRIFMPHTELLRIQESVSLNWWQETLNAVFGSLSVLTILTNYPQLVINVVPGKTQLAATIYAKALPDRSVQNVYNGRIFIKKKILWLISVEVDITNKTLASTSSMLPIDGAPGGIYDVSAFGLGSSNPAYKYIKQTSFCFIPTVSALALTDWENRLATSLNGINFYALGLTPFQYHFTQANNEYHTRFNSSASFLYNHLTNGCTLPQPVDIYIQNQTISTNRYFRGRNIYVGKNVTPNLPQGNVLISNGAHVLFDTSENVYFDAGFECEASSTFETTNH